jgi:hypothetical protein
VGTGDAGGAGADARTGPGGGGCVPRGGCRCQDTYPPRYACTSTRFCDDGCNECRCDVVTQQWGCTKRACSNPPGPACPPPGAPPLVDGSPCPRDGETCLGPEKCSPRCACKASVWRCDANPCGLDCPASAPVGQQACAERGQVCRYGGWCATTCTCEVVTPDINAWRCSSPPC